MTIVKAFFVVNKQNYKGGILEKHGFRKAIQYSVNKEFLNFVFDNKYIYF